MGLGIRSSLIMYDSKLEEDAERRTREEVLEHLSLHEQLKYMPRAFVMKHTRASKDAIMLVINSPLWSIFILLLSLYAIFEYDIRILAVPVEFDSIWMFMNMLVMMIFAVEIIAHAFAEKGLVTLMEQ